MSARQTIVIGALLGAIGVPLGAFGYHGLADRLAVFDLTTAQQSQLVDRFEVAVRYQMIHAPVLILIGLLRLHGASRALGVAAWSLLLGVLLFSGFLYASVFMLGKIPWFVHVVPFGGLLMIVGWVLLAVAAGGIAAEQSNETAEQP